MSVIDRNVIDFSYLEDEEAILCISDHLTWENDVLKAHWEILQDKLKDYMGFIQSGQFREKYPEENLKPCIKIYFSYMWPDLVDKFLNKLKIVYKEYGCDLIWIFDPHETDIEEKVENAND